MGTNGKISARDSRAKEETSAAGRLIGRAAPADALEAAIKESQTVLITLLSCRFFSMSAFL